MSNCKKCKTNDCGCEKGLTTATPCEHNTPVCPNPDPCSETFSSNCVIYDKDTIVDIGVVKGDSMSNILQLIALHLTNPTCIGTGASCSSVIGLQSTSKTSISVSLGWTIYGSNPTNFQVEYKQASSGTWLLAPLLVGTATSHTVAGLTSNTDYHFRVASICQGPSTCYSVTILVKTNV
jgi:hypothetical protein